MQQYRLVAGGVAACLKQGQAGQYLRIAINHAIAQCWMIPMRTSGGEAWMAAACQFIMRTLNNKFCVCKGIVIARMIYIKMCANKHIDVIGTQIKIGEMLDHILFLF